MTNTALTRLLIPAPGGWLYKPPSPQEIQLALESGYEHSHGQVLAAAYIAHASIDKNSLYLSRDLWRPGRVKNSTAWFGTTRQRIGHWSIWWWRQCYWPVWSNTRQWLFHGNSATIIAVPLDYEVDQNITCFYHHKNRWIGTILPTLTPTKPHEWFDYIWRDVPSWRPTYIKKCNLLWWTKRHPTKRRYGTKGKYYLLEIEGSNIGCVFSARQLDALLHPAKRNFPLTKLRMSTPVQQVKANEFAPAWLAVTTSRGIAMTARRSLFNKYTLKVDERCVEALEHYG